jgi:hypothetical protein
MDFYLKKYNVTFVNVLLTKAFFYMEFYFKKYNVIFVNVLLTKDFFT